MKKFWMLALAAAMGLLLLAGCGTGGEEAYSTDLVQSLVKAGAFSEELDSLDGDTAFALYKLGDYGLAREDLTDCAVLRSAGATCEEGAVLVLADKDKAAKALEAVKAYVDGQITANESYRPAEIPKLKVAITGQRDNTVLLVVANDGEAAQNAIG